MELPLNRSLLTFLLATFYYLLQKTSCAIGATFPCTTFRDCNPNERCLKSGFCDCKFGYTARKWSSNRKLWRQALFETSPYYCDLFTCTGDAACRQKYGNQTLCRNFECACSKGTSVDFATQRCAPDQDLKDNNNKDSDSAIPAWVYWIWRQPQTRSEKVEQQNATEKNVLKSELKTKANYSELAYIKCFTSAQCVRLFGPDTVCAPTSRQCELRAFEDEAGIFESSYYYLLLRWIIIGAIILLAVFCVCRSSFFSSSSSKDSEG